LGLAAGLVLLGAAEVFPAPFLAAGFLAGTSDALPFASAASAAPLAAASLPAALPLPVADRSRKSSSFGSAAYTQAAPNKPHSQSGRGYAAGQHGGAHERGDAMTCTHHRSSAGSAWGRGW
jgi:hypothetical protein